MCVCNKTCCRYFICATCVVHLRESVKYFTQQISHKKLTCINSFPLERQKNRIKEKRDSYYYWVAHVTRSYKSARKIVSIISEAWTNQLQTCVCQLKSEWMNRMMKKSVYLYQSKEKKIGFSLLRTSYTRLTLQSYHGCVE